MKREEKYHQALANLLKVIDESECAYEYSCNGPLAGDYLGQAVDPQHPAVLAARELLKEITHELS